MSLSFHSYVTLRNRALASGDERARAFAKSLSSAEYRRELLRRAVAQYGLAKTDKQKLAVLVDRSPAAAEENWVALHRPYYNCYPVAVDLSRTVRLDLTFQQIQNPRQFSTVLLRFAVGKELSGQLATALVFWDQPFPDGSAYLRIHLQFAGGMAMHQKTGLQFRYRPVDRIEEWLATLAREKETVDWSKYDDSLLPALDSLDAVSESLIRLVVFVGLLSRGNDLITPVLLKKDRQEWEATDNPAVKAWLERRAARRTGSIGFDVCRKLDEERERSGVSPHLRNCHLALFWTGPGRTIPIIKMRSGSVVLRASMTDMPTGYQGPETKQEDEAPTLPPLANNVPISASQRFRVLRRDNFRCQICGASANDTNLPPEGIRLEVDHRVPRVAGGSNDEDSNLWTLCRRCNRGKADRVL